MIELPISEARREWNKAIWEGPSICPVCDRMGKVYPRRFGIPMAKSLLWLYHKAPKGEWIHIPTFGSRYVLRTNQWGHMAKFGVCEAMPPEEDAKTKHSGYYRITEYGRAVAQGAKIPEYIFTYNDQRIESAGEIREITISDALEGEDFDIAELLKPAKEVTSRKVQSE